VGRKAGGPTFTERARRAQIVAAAIDTIADLGFARASYAQIAKRAGLSSTGLISYHFASKDELIDEVVAEVVAAGQAYMLPRIEAAEDKLRAYIESNLEFMATHRAHIVAVVAVFTALPRAEDGQPSAYSERHRRGLEQLAELLRAGQRAGELRRFDALTMAMAIRAAIDAVGFRLATERDLDVRPIARELATLFDRATRA
jgi:AcrR family transcriptional regulator